MSNNVIIDGRLYGGKDLLDELDDVGDLRKVAKELRAHLHRSREYVAKLEHDHGLLRDALDSIQYQTHLTMTTARRIARMATAGLQVGPYWPGQKFIHPDQPTREAMNGVNNS